ncbi:MAG: 6-phosphofructokinase [Psychrilyobacter sp.]|nr:6-phosphofructokinase [Psychrilyobacter sp.]
MKKIAILTSGGDAPGMNAAIRSATKFAIYQGIEVFGIRRGYKGMVENDIFKLSGKDVSGIIDRGGTVLLSARLPEFKDPEVRAKAAANLKANEIEGLIVIGGDGSFHGADLLYKEHGIKVIGIPGTIDNDIIGTDYTIGYDTTLNIIIEAMVRLRDTATSHERTYLVEVMGRDAGDLALYASLAAGGDGFLIPEDNCNLEELARVIKLRREAGKLHDIILVSEGVGSAYELGKELKELVNTELRITVLGHTQRGGAPSAFDRVLATKMGAKAVKELMAGESGRMICSVSNKIVTKFIDHAWNGIEDKTQKRKDTELAHILSL